MEQRSREWFIARLGKFTGSQIGKLMGKTRMASAEFTDTALGYIQRVASERLVSKAILENTDEVFFEYINWANPTNKAMQRGVDMELPAKVELEMLLKHQIKDLPSIVCEECPSFSCSPDGIINGKVCVEIKCPSQETHAKYGTMKSSDDLKKVNSDYYYQCQSEMLVTKTSKLIFCSYCPECENPLYVIMIDADEEVQNAILEKVKKADAEVEKILAAQKENADNIANIKETIDELCKAG